MCARLVGRACFCARPPPVANSHGSIPMTFKYSHTFPISGPNKLPRFKQWAAQHTPEIEVSLPPQVPVKSENMTVRLKSADDRQKLMEKLASATF
jgi:hypothetical protein